MVGSIVLFQFCPCWTLLILWFIFSPPFNAPSAVTCCPSPLLIDPFSLMSLTCLSSPVSPLSVASAHIYTYYCINQHHNFLVLIHVNCNLVKLRAKRTGYANRVCVCTCKNVFLFLFLMLCSLQFLFVHHRLRVFDWLQSYLYALGFILASHFWTLDFETNHSVFLLACWQGFLYRSFLIKVFDVHMNACIPENVPKWQRDARTLAGEATWGISVSEACLSLVRAGRRLPPFFICGWSVVCRRCYMTWANWTKAKILIK